MNKRNAILGSVLMTTMLALAATVAVKAAPDTDQPAGDQSGYQRHDWHRGHGQEGMFDRLDLTQAQRDQVKQIMSEGKETRQEKMKALWANRQALQQAAMADNYDAAHVRQLADQQAKIMADLTVIRTESFHRIYALLTPDQKKKLAEMKQNRHFGGRGQGPEGAPR